MSRARTAVSCLHPAHLGQRPHRLVSGPLHGHHRIGPECTQRVPEFAAADGGYPNRFTPVALFLLEHHLYQRKEFSPAVSLPHPNGACPRQSLERNTGVHPQATRQRGPQVARWLHILVLLFHVSASFET
jgi:hypothetical protein